MSDPRFYYYPDGGSALETVDLGEGLSDIDIVPAIRRTDAIGLDGSFYSAVGGPNWTVRIVLERFGTPGAINLERQLTTLLSHLRNGGLCGFSRDHAKTWAAIRSGVTGRGYSYVATHGNAFSAWSASAALASGDEVALEQAPPMSIHEIRGVSGMTGNQINLAETQVHEFDATKGAAWARHRDFFPVCYLAAEDAQRNPLTHDHRRNYTLDLKLTFSPSAMAALFASDAYTSKAGRWDAGTGTAAIGLSAATATYAKNGGSLEALVRAGSGKTGGAGGLR